MLLAQHLPQRKALIVLDDVDDVSQLDRLLPVTGLHRDSLVIITSRQKCLLDLRCLTHEVQLLPEDLALKLFTAIAFPGGEAPQEVAAYVPTVVASCGGLPLTLKVCADACLHSYLRPLVQRAINDHQQCSNQQADMLQGPCKVMAAHLRCFGHQPGRWSEALVKLQKAERLAPDLGEERLFSRLRISYDALEPSEKSIFLDAACFLLGRRAATAKRVWSGCAAWGRCKSLYRSLACCLNIMGTDSSPNYQCMLLSQI